MARQFYLRHLLALVTVACVLAGLIHAAFLSPKPFESHFKVLLLGFSIYLGVAWFLRWLATYFRL